MTKLSKKQLGNAMFLILGTAVIISVFFGIILFYEPAPKVYQSEPIKLPAQIQAEKVKEAQIILDKLDFKKVFEKCESNSNIK